MKLTVKLGKVNRSIADLLKANHGLEGPLKDWDGIPGSELYYGQSYESEPKWKLFLEEGAGEFLPQMVNQGAAAILFIPMTGKRYMIYLFGYGFLGINDYFTEWDFGIKVVLNSIDPAGIKSMDAHTIAYKAKNKRVQLAEQGGIGAFDIDILQDLVSQVSGRSIDAAFATSLTGGESLSINTDLEGSSISKKSHEIIRKYRLKSYQDEFIWIDFISPVKDQTLIDTLNRIVEQKLNELIQGIAVHEFVLSFPTIIDIASLDYIRFGGIDSDREFDMVNMSDFLREYRHLGNHRLNHSLNNVFLNLYDGYEKIFKSFSFYKALTTEIAYLNSCFILTNGTWFKLDQGHFLKVTAFFDQMIFNGAEYTGNEQTNERNEEHYLSSLPINGCEVLDRTLYRAKGNRNTIEYADIVNDQQEIIHVKDGGSSGKLSHLFNQGLVSSRLLLADKEFRTRFKAAIKDRTIKGLYQSARLDPSSITIVFRILRKGPSFQLPFFSKIVLYDTYHKIKSMGYRFRLEWVEYI
jgi:uncharacterized protein (TIGR04141 family)